MIDNNECYHLQLEEDQVLGGQTNNLPSSSSPSLRGRTNPWGRRKGGMAGDHPISSRVVAGRDVEHDHIFPRNNSPS